MPPGPRRLRRAPSLRVWGVRPRYVVLARPANGARRPPAVRRGQRRPRRARKGSLPEPPTRPRRRPRRAARRPRPSARVSAPAAPSPSACGEQLPGQRSATWPRAPGRRPRASLDSAKAPRRALKRRGSGARGQNGHDTSPGVSWPGNTDPEIPSPVTFRAVGGSEGEGSGGWLVWTSRGRPTRRSDGRSAGARLRDPTALKGPSGAGRGHFGSDAGARSPGAENGREAARARTRSESPSR